MHLGDASEDKERDLADRDSVPQRHERVAQLVKENRPKQQQRSDAAHHPVARDRKARNRLRQIPGGQAPRDEPEDQEPGYMDLDRDAQDAADLPIAAIHSKRLLPPPEPGDHESLSR